MSVAEKIPIISDLMGGDEEEEEKTAEEEVEEMLNKADEDQDIHISGDATSLAPNETQIYRDKIVSDGKFFRTFVVDDWPPMIQQDVFKNILKSAKLDFDFSLQLEPYEDQSGVDKLETLASKLEDKREGDFAKFTSNKESMQQTENTLSVLKQHITEGEKLFDVTFYITLRADSEKELERNTDELKNKLTRESRLGLNECRYQQKDALVSNSPAAINKLAEHNDSFKQLMLSSAVARTFPFLEDTFMEQDGVLYGINENSMTPVFVDIFARANGYNQLTTGMIGSGKSFSTSQVLLEMERAYNDFQQFIIDPMGGFLGVNNALDGDRIVIGGDEPINPLEISKTPEHVMEKAQGKLDPWSMKKNELRWFFTEFFYDPENEEGLSSHEKGMLDQAITMTYNKKGITKDIETHSKESPTIMDLIDVLQSIAEDAEEFSNTELEEEADKQREIALNLLLRMKPFKEGGEYHNLAQPTKIDINTNDVIYLDLQQIPENSDNLGIMMQLLFMKIYQNAKSTEDKVAITIDEAHKILGDENITGGLEELFRHSRHFDLSINLISQTPEEFYVNQTAENIAKQCTIKRFHRVDSLDEELAKNKLELNDSEIQFIEDAEMGKGEKNYSEALLTIQDSDRSIPLRIEATNDEAMVIDYDPTESIQEYDTGSEQQLKRALDIYNRNDNPIFVGDSDELSQEVKSQIVKKRRNRRRLIAEEDPSLLTEEERQQLDTIDSDEGDNNNSELSTQSPGDIEQTEAGVQATSDSAEEENTSNEDHLMRHMTPQDVRELDTSEVRDIIELKNLDINTDQPRNELEEKIISEFFGKETMVDDGEDTNLASNSDANDDEINVEIEDGEVDVDVDISDDKLKEITNNDGSQNNGNKEDEENEGQSEMWGQVNGPTAESRDGDNDDEESTESTQVTDTIQKDKGTSD